MVGVGGEWKTYQHKKQLAQMSVSLDHELFQAINEASRGDTSLHAEIHNAAQGSASCLDAKMCAAIEQSHEVLVHEASPEIAFD